MRLHNRQIKATFWNDGDLLRWPRDKRMFYEGLFCLADDSGCLDESAFEFKINIFPSPVDADITVEIIAAWVEELVEQRKAVRYTVGEKRCLYLANFRKHQKIDNASRPSVPLPPWLTFEPFKSNGSQGVFTLSYEPLNTPLDIPYDDLNNTFQPEFNRNSTGTGIQPESYFAADAPTAEAAPPVGEKMPEKPTPTDAERQIIEIFDRKRINKVQARAIAALEEQYGLQTVIRSGLWMRAKDMALDTDRLASACRTFARDAPKDNSARDPTGEPVRARAGPASGGPGPPDAIDQALDFLQSGGSYFGSG